MRIEQDRLGRLKQWIYIGSAAVLFVTWCLSLAALTQKGPVDARLGWVFGLCFLTVPLLIYQSLTPMWSRTARFSTPHAHCIVDALLCLFWFAAWVALASYVASGKGKGSNSNTNDNANSSGCDNFAHGSATKCKISEADIVFSVALMLCFVATAFFSFRVLMEYRRTGIAPNAAFAGAGAGASKAGGVVKQGGWYPQSGGGVGHKEEDEAFDSRLDVDEGRNTGYSFEDARVQGGAPGLGGGYGGLGVPQPYGGSGYESVPNPAVEHDGYIGDGRPTSFGGPLGGTHV